jgi:hypothetical protein
MSTPPAPSEQTSSVIHPGSDSHRVPSTCTRMPSETSKMWQYISVRRSDDALSGRFSVFVRMQLDSSVCMMTMNMEHWWYDAYKRTRNKWQYHVSQCQFCTLHLIWPDLGLNKDQHTAAWGMARPTEASASPGKHIKMQIPQYSQVGRVTQSV